MSCLVCLSSSVTEHLDLGAHPVSSFFLKTRDAPEQTYSLSLGQCETCGTIQLMEPVPHTALVPPYDWLFAREPEEHLDAVVEKIIAHTGLTPDSVIAGLTFKDDTTIDRFTRKGFARNWRIRLDEDLGVADVNTGIETVQRLTEPDRMKAIAARRGAADLLIVRHILEHTENLHAFVLGLGALVKPGGYVMIEVPDCTGSLERNDFAMVWEEHSLYLTPETFAAIMTLAGFEPVWTDVHPFPFENSLVQLARKTSAPGRLRITEDALATRGQLKTYAAPYEPTTRALRRYLEDFRRRRGKIALFGAGHLACAFANFHGLADLIELVADDTPQKQGLFLPGARLPIMPSPALVDNDIKLCILALSINNEDKVIARNQAFAKAGGQFCSIFAASPRSIRNLAGP